MRGRISVLIEGYDTIRTHTYVSITQSDVKGFNAPTSGAYFFMMNGLIATKIKQTQTFTKEGIRIPVTLVSTCPLIVAGIKTVSRDGYSAVVLGLGHRKASLLSRPVAGMLKKAGDGVSVRFLKEISATPESMEGLTVGQSIQPSQVFAVGDYVSVTGISKGKGFQGGVRRHHFRGGPRTHGQSDRERAPGSIGQTTTPGRVYRGKRMAGRMGNDQVTVKNLKVVEINDQSGMVIISGLIPGPKDHLVSIVKS